MRNAPNALTLTLSREYTGEGTRGRLIRFLVISALCLIAVPAVAQTRPAATGIEAQSVQRTKPAATANADSSVNWQRLVLAMVVVLGLIVALRYVAGWLLPSTRTGGGGRGVRVLARTPISPRQQVLLLHVGRRVLVVGDSAGTLSSLASIDQPDEVAELIGQVGATPTPVVSRFKAMFGRAENEYEPATDTNFREDPDRPDAAAHDEEFGNVSAPDPAVAAARDEISGLMDRMRSLSKTVRR